MHAAAARRLAIRILNEHSFIFLTRINPGPARRP